MSEYLILIEKFDVQPRLLTTFWVEVAPWSAFAIDTGSQAQ